MSESTRNVSQSAFTLLRPCLTENPQTKDTPEDFKDAPIALQLAGKHFRDEDTIAASEMVSRIIQQ